MTTPRKDEISGAETTGHEWDGIEELDNPMPRWWLWVFFVTIIWAVVYWIFMPAWPLVSDYSRGMLGYSQRASVADSIAEARKAQSVYMQRLADTPIEKVKDDPDLLAFTVSGGRSVFAVNCSQCHGSGAAGAKGYPNLNDDDWLWGGSLAEIERTILVGIRSTHADTRINDMPAFVRDGMLQPAQASDIAEYVLSLSQRSTDVAAAGRGQKLFAENCVACHGENGRGNRELGAPNLVDSIWLYGDDKAAIVAQISNSRGGVMPTWEGRLDPLAIKQLTLYIHSLGGGE